MKQELNMNGIKELINQIESSEHNAPAYIVHELLELCMAVTGRGYTCEDYTETIGFPMNDLWVISDSYYGRTWFEIDDDETEIEDDETLVKLAKELKKRLLAFDRRISTTREKTAKEVFDKPLDNIFPKEVTR